MSAELRPGGGASQALSWRTNDQDRWSLVLLHRELSLIEFSSSNPSLTLISQSVSLSHLHFIPLLSLLYLDISLVLFSEHLSVSTSLISGLLIVLGPSF